MDNSPDDRWRLLFRAGAVGAFWVVAMIPVQIGLFAIWPPSFEVEAVFATFAENWLRGLESLDVLLLLDAIVTLPMFLALAILLWPQQRSFAALALVAAVSGTAAYFSANTSLELFDLARQYAAAGDPELKSQYLAAGRFALAHFQGTGFAVYYVLGGVATLLMSLAMLRGTVFGRSTAWIGVLSGVTMLVPPLPVFGIVGIVVSLLSLAPLIVWLALVGVRLWRLADSRPEHVTSSGAVQARK